MRTLAFDTAGAQCAVALWCAGRVTARAAAASHGHAVLLAPMIAEVLAEAGVAAGALQRIAVTRGPGGFTGVRVGLATARGLALATGAEVVAPTTFEALLLGLDPAGLGDVACVLAAVDSRREAVFVQPFDRALAPLAGPSARLPACLAEGLAGPVLVVGDASEAAAAALAAAGIAVAGTRPGGPAAAAMARAGAEGRLAGPATPLYLAEPAVTGPAT